VLEFGHEAAFKWLRQTFSEAEIRRVLLSESRLPEKSAAFWALVYPIRSREVAALNHGRETPCSLA